MTDVIDISLPIGDDLPGAAGDPAVEVSPTVAARTATAAPHGRCC